MRNVELQVPLRVYTRAGALIAQIGEQRRIPVSYEQIPELVKHAFLAAEDERFFEHHGIDYLGVMRAVLVDFISGDKTQGASTITMQAARNMFLTPRQDLRAGSCRRPSSPTAWSMSSPSRKSSASTST